MVGVAAGREVRPFIGRPRPSRSRHARATLPPRRRHAALHNDSVQCWRISVRNNDEMLHAMRLVS